MGFMRRRSARQVDEHRAADPAAVRANALALLARREYASGELSEALVRKGFDALIVAEVIAEMRGEQLINDARYAESLVRMLVGRGQGPARIRPELQQAGLSADQVAEALAGAPDWHGLAADVRRRKFGAERPADWPERARQMRFLQYRGFSKDHIASALGGSGAEDPGDVGASPDDDP